MGRDKSTAIGMVKTDDSLVTVVRSLVFSCFAAMLIVLTGCFEPGSYEIGPRPMSKVIVFRPLVGTSQSTPSGTQVIFLFRNADKQSIALPGFLAPPTAGVFQPSFMQYEVQRDNNWHPLDVAYDGLPEDYVVEPGTELRLLVSLGPIEKLERCEDNPDSRQIEWNVIR